VSQSTADPCTARYSCLKLTFGSQSNAFGTPLVGSAPFVHSVSDICLSACSAFPTFHLYSGGRMVQLVRGADRAALQRAIAAHSANLAKDDAGALCGQGTCSGEPPCGAEPFSGNSNLDEILDRHSHLSFIVRSSALILGKR